MKTVVRKDTNVSLYLFPDTTVVLLNASQMQVGENPIEFLVLDCDTSNAIIYENVTNPNNWMGWKYLYNGSAWVDNPNWIDPNTPEA
jgi:hypothetical protein